MYTLYYKVFSCWSAHCYPIKPHQIATGYKQCSSCSSHVTIAASRLSPAYPAPRFGRLPLREQQAQRWRARQGRRQSGRRYTRGREVVCALKGSRFLWVGLRCLLPCCLAALPPGTHFGMQIKGNGTATGESSVVGRAVRGRGDKQAIKVSSDSLKLKQARSSRQNK